MSLLREIGYASAAILKTLVGPMLGKDELIDSVGYVVSNGPPTSVVPDFIGQHLYDSSTPTWYKAHGVAAGQWTLSGVPSNVVLAQTDPLTGGISFSAGGSYHAASIAPPHPTGVVADDHIALTAFFDAAPNNAIIEFPKGANYTVFGGAIRHRPGQIINYNNCTITRADEIVTTTTGETVYGSSITVNVTDTSGFLVGQTIAIYGTKSGGDTVIAPECRITSIGAGSITFDRNASFVNVTAGTYVTDTILTGANLFTRGALIDSYSYPTNTTSESILNLRIDGNAAGNTTNNRWEYSIDLRMNTKGGSLENILITDSCGEGVYLAGTSPRIKGLYLYNLNGNGVHLSSCSDAFLRDIYIDTCNTDTGIGHSDGGIIASDAVYRTIVDGFSVINSKKSAVGSWDQATNSFAKLINGYAKNCWNGLSTMASVQGTDLELGNITVENCGVSMMGCNRDVVGSRGKALRWSITNVKFIDSMASFFGLSHSTVDVTAYHSDSTTNTSTTTASGRADNWTPYVFTALGGIIQFVGCDNSKLSARVFDGAASPTAGKACIEFRSSAGGPIYDNEFMFDTVGGGNGIQCNGYVSVNNRGLLRARNWKTGNAGVRLNLVGVSVDAAFVSGYEKSKGNDFTVDIRYDKSNAAASTFGCAANSASTSGGWLTIRGRVEFVTTCAATVYGLATQTATYKTRFDNVEVIGPASNFTPYLMAAGNAAGDGRLNNWRSYPAPSAAGSNWVAETTGVTLIA